MARNIPPINLGELNFKFIQGGMGVGISISRLASAVAEAEGAGIIASVGLGILRGNFAENKRINREKINAASEDERKKIIAELYIQANQEALRDEIRLCREKTKGVIGVNIMHALSDYPSLVQASIEEKVDLIISGAGVPRDLPKYLNGSKTKLVPIVSSGTIAKMILRAWKPYVPDAIVVEGPKAGGHLGYSHEQLADDDFVQNGLERIVKDVLKEVKVVEEATGRKIPIIAAGGIFYGGDIERAIGWGAAGVQMATRFVPTKECDASEKFKQEYLDCKKEDIKIIKSPVGMPGRAISNKFLERVEKGETTPIACPYHCLKTCIPEKSPYCIANALLGAQKGYFENGYVFAGANAHLCKETITVSDLVRKLDEEYSDGKTSQ